MKFASKVHKETFQKIQEYLRELFEDPYFDEATGHFYARYGSTVLEISADPYGPEEAIVKLMAYCVQGVKVDQALMVGLLERNNSQPVGAFSLVGNDIFFSQSLFGSTLERRNLLGAIAAVATVSDDYDDKIVQHYGGQTALDRIQDTGGTRGRITRHSLIQDQDLPEDETEN